VTPDRGAVPEDGEAEDAPESLGEFLRLLDLEELDTDLYRAHNPHHVAGRHRLFGGQVAAQALRAATLTVVDRLPHSLHGYFLRPGRSDLPTILRVDRDRDGRSVSARRVTAVQDGQAIFTLSASFTTGSEGPALSPTLPDGTPRPEEVAPVRLAEHGGMFELRPVAPAREKGLADVYWARATVSLPDDELLHACVLTYLSDLGVPQGDLGDQLRDLQAPSVDHAVWFHRHVRLDDWVLFTMRALATRAGRHLYTGSIFGVDGTLGATMFQECLLRPRPRP
jgi:acyl-CoA thioesterase-2